MPVPYSETFDKAIPYMASLRHAHIDKIDWDKVPQEVHTIELFDVLAPSVYITHEDKMYYKDLSTSLGWTETECFLVTKSVRAAKRPVPPVDDFPDGYYKGGTKADGFFVALRKEGYWYLPALAQKFTTDQINTGNLTPIEME